MANSLLRDKPGTYIREGVHSIRLVQEEPAKHDQNLQAGRLKVRAFLIRLGGEHLVLQEKPELAQGREPEYLPRGVGFPRAHEAAILLQAQPVPELLRVAQPRREQAHPLRNLLGVRPFHDQQDAARDVPGGGLQHLRRGQLPLQGVPHGHRLHRAHAALLRVPAENLRPGGFPDPEELFPVVRIVLAAVLLEDRDKEDAEIPAEGVRELAVFRMRVPTILLLRAVQPQLGFQPLLRRCSQAPELIVPGKERLREVARACAQLPKI